MTLVHFSSFGLPFEKTEFADLLSSYESKPLRRVYSGRSEESWAREEYPGVEEQGSSPVMAKVNGRSFLS
jgi:hypothetical protein